MNASPKRSFGRQSGIFIGPLFFDEVSNKMVFSRLAFCPGLFLQTVLNKCFDEKLKPRFWKFATSNLATKRTLTIGNQKGYSTQGSTDRLSYVDNLYSCRFSTSRSRSPNGPLSSIHQLSQIILIYRLTGSNGPRGITSSRFYSSAHLFRIRDKK